MTSLSVYGTNASAPTLPTAGLLASGTGASASSTNTTKIGTATGYSEIFALGTAAAWTAAGSLVAPSGNGWLFDVTDLENQQLQAGNYTPVINSKISVGTATADMYVCVYKLANDLATYTSIGNVVLSAQSLTTVLTQYAFSAGSLPAMSFGPGDKLYYTVQYNVTVNGSGSGAATIGFAHSNNATKGRAGFAELDTPGYVSAITVNMTLTNAGLNLLRDGQSGANNPLIKYVALGTSNTAPTTSDTKLGNEIFRKAVTTYTNGATGELLINMYLAPGDAVGDGIQEIGFFGGSAAASTANTGVLYAHGLYTHTKTNAESLTFQLDNTLTIA